MLIADGDAFFPVFSFPGPFAAARELGPIGAGYGLHAAGLADMLIDPHRDLSFAREVSGVEDRDKCALVGNPGSCDAVL